MSESSPSLPFDDAFHYDESLDEDVCPNCDKSFFDHNNNQIIECARAIQKET